MAMIVLVNGRPMQGRLELKLNPAGNYSIVSAQMVPAEEEKAATSPPAKVVAPVAPIKA